MIVPGGTYVLQSIDAGCATNQEASFSLPLRVTMSRWADTSAPFDAKSNGWPGPDGSVDITADVLAMLAKFANEAVAPSKTRIDIQPDLPDRVVDIVDINFSVDAFRGFTYPFPPPPPPCP